MPTPALWLMVLAFLSVAPAASAQTPAHSFAELQPLLKATQTLIVTDRTGKQASGDFVSIQGNQLELDAGRSRLIFAEDAVRQIRRLDGNWDGTLIGGAIGVALGWAVVATCKNEFTHTHEVTLDCVATSVLLPLGLGWLGGQVDGMIHKLLYVQPQQSVAISIAPIVGRARIGAAATISFKESVR